MVKERPDSLTRANVLQIGFSVLLVGALGYGGFRLLGFEGASAGIAAEALLVLIVIGWTGSYLLRVVTGKMTYSEQRQRYRKAYEQITTAELQAQFDSMPEAEQILLLKDLENQRDSKSPSSD